MSAQRFDGAVEGFVGSSLRGDRNRFVESFLRRACTHTNLLESEIKTVEGVSGHPPFAAKAIPAVADMSAMDIAIVARRG